jgi:hypothetical protein
MIKSNFLNSEIISHIKNNFDPYIRILNIGEHSDDSIPFEEFENVDCIEYNRENLQKYNLRRKYKNTFVCNLIDCDINFTNYDLIVFNYSQHNFKGLSFEFDIKKFENSDLIFLFKKEDNFEISEFKELIDKFGRVSPICVGPEEIAFSTKESSDIFIHESQNEKTKKNLEIIKLIFTDSSEEKTDYPEQKIKINKDIIETVNNETTIVTALWNLGRGDIDESFKRGYDDYLKKFKELLSTDIPMYIFIDKSDEEFIWSVRKKENTVLNFMSKEELNKWFEFTEITNKIRKDEKWLNQASWLKESPQATLDSYNPMVMSKMFMLNNVTIWNPFNSKYFFWIDAGITNTVHYGYFTHDKVFDKLSNFVKNNKGFLFITYPYIGAEEIHGFERKKLAKLCNTDYVKYVCRGGFFGGEKDTINEINGLYYGYLSSSLKDGYMGTEESIFTVLMYNHEDKITQYSIEDNGLIWPFFEDLKDGTYSRKIVKNEKTIKETENYNLEKVALYVITFNSPNQLITLIDSMKSYDEDFVNKPKKYILNNSTDRLTDEQYKKIAEEYNFEIIWPETNLGITGGRQFIASHFESLDLDFYFFFEDDMFFYIKDKEVCRNGFNRYTKNLYLKTLEISRMENFDFLKLNFTEFFGDNSTQWSWYNVPQVFRESHWPNNKKLPQIGLDPNAPKTQFKEIKSHKGVPYASGEIYLCNWPILFTKKGNYKCYLETVYASPFEQTLMSHNYQETIKGNVNPGILLMTPTEHNRFEHYDGSLRKEC